jgi:general secretion pathway protein D
VNIVLRLDEGAGGSLPGPAAAVPAPVAPAAPVIPGLEPVPGAVAPAAAAVVAGAPVGNPADAHITVSLTNIPLGEALRYVTSLANLKYKVEEYAVSVVPLNVPTDALFTKEWKVPPSMFAGAPGAGAANPLDLGATTAGAGGAAAAGGDRTRGTSGLAARVDAKDSLTAAGVVFPQGSSAVYLASSSKLIVKNTQENLDLIDAIVQAQLLSGPVQVEIESKFVEIQQNNLKELSFDTLLGQGNVPGSGKVFFGGGTTGSATGLDQSQFPFPIGSGTAQTFPTGSGLRTGTQAISQNAIDALLAGTSGLSAPSPATAAIAGIFSDPTFQVIIHAIDQKKGIDLLSAPRVTTKSGQRAVVEVIREFRYPTEFQPPQIPQTFGNTGGNQAVSILPNGTINPLASQDQGSFPVTPTTPTAFETRNTGVTLEVEPVIGPDNYTIDLNLVPQVVEFEGFVNYGSPIQTTSTNGLGQTTTNIITPNVINQPIFSTRKVTTSVSVFDGQTVVLGGLMSEDVQKVEDKIPLLGDLPLFGRLFRSNSEQHLKTNLVIFVTARLINPAGEAVHSEEETEEVVEKVPLPEVNEASLPLMPK